MTCTRVLVIATTYLGYEGITSVIMNYYRNIDREKIQYDFILGCGAMEWVKEEINELGGRVYDIGGRNKRTVRYIHNIIKIIKENKYNIVHIHGNSATMYIDVLAAKLGGANVRIAHSHNSTCNHKIIHSFLKKPLNKIVTEPVACSEVAGKWIFDKKFKVINNGIDINKFTFNQSIRDEYRKKLGISNKFVIGHVGHFSYQKNHQYLIEVFSEVVKRNPSAILILIGDGKLKCDVEIQINQLGLQDNVLMLGKRSDTAQLMQAMDIFVFPSRFEGLPVVLVEAQAAGLECIVSSEITREVNETNKIKYLNLESGISVWSKEILKFKEKYSRNDVKEIMINSKFNIKREVKKIERIYLKGE